ncbi:carbohydrate esterase family 15 protein [Xylogone sp. PMI_703]|nr:carbohydrate esterase family 15 protein [Xylogone sp. PMI_703]
MASRLLSVALFAIPTLALWEQCGGQGWTGSTTCNNGGTCVAQNQWYSQCIPLSSTTVRPPSTSTTTTLVTSVSASGPSTTPGGGTPTTCPAFPGNVPLTTYTPLPDPFQPLSGARVTTKNQFACRQKEIQQLFQNYETGALPGKPQSVTASLSGSTLTINVSDNGKSISFTVSIKYPTSGTAPYPAIIAYAGGSIPAPAGVAMISFNNDDIAAQVSASGSRGVGKFYTLYGSSATASAMTAWAWGVSRIIDALEITSSARINTQRIGVTGCSRNGKGAMLAGAYEPRIALTIPQESGSGGAACWRLSDAAKAQGANIQTASEIITEDPWFSLNFNNYVNKIPVLPFDHHMLAGLVAPRGMLVIENNIDWLGPQSTYGCMKAASLIYQALGASDHFGYSEPGGHTHCAFPSSQQGVLTAFVNKFLLDQNTNTANVMQTDQTFDQNKWVPWSVPTLS